jgi:hypothetical protein
LKYPQLDRSSRWEGAANNIQSEYCNNPRSAFYVQNPALACSCRGHRFVRGLLPTRADAMTVGTVAGIQAAIDGTNLIEDVRYVCRHRWNTSGRRCYSHQPPLVPLALRTASNRLKT